MGFLQDCDTIGSQLMILSGPKRKPLRWQNCNSQAASGLSGLTFRLHPVHYHLTRLITKTIPDIVSTEQLSGMVTLLTSWQSVFPTRHLVRIDLLIYYELIITTYKKKATDIVGFSPTKMKTAYGDGISLLCHFSNTFTVISQYDQFGQFHF